MAENQKSAHRRSRREARRKRNRKVLIAAVAVLLVIGAGWGARWWVQHSVDPKQLIRSAEQYAAKGDYASAQIQIRNAVQASPKDGRLRFLFAQILEGARDPASAEQEARKAIALGYDAEEVVPVIARAMLRLGRAEDLVKEFGSLKLRDPKAQSDLKSIVGDANLSVERFDAAETAFDTVLRDDPTNALALVGRAKVLLSKSDTEGARSILTDLLKRSPPPKEALSLQADLNRATGNLKQAIADYEKLVALDEDDASARFRLGRAYFEDKQYDRAEQTAAALSKKIPGDPRGGYLAGLVALQTGDLERARRLAVEVLSKVPTHGPSQLLAGVSSVETGQYEQGKGYLQGLLGTPAFRIHAYKALIKAYLRTGDASRARVLAEEALAIAPQDPILQTLAAEASMGSGDLASAAKHFENSGKGKGANATRLGQTLIASGQTEKGIEVLESALQAPESKLQSTLTLAVVHLQKREFAKALPLLDELEKLQPQSATAPALRGTAYFAKGDLKGARAQLEAALKREPENIVALDTLAQIDVKEQHTDQAKARFESVLKRSPNNEAAALGFAHFLRQQKTSPDTVTAVLEDMIRSNPNVLRSRLALIDVYLDYGNPAKAVSTGRDALAANPNNITVMQALGRAHLSANEAQQAVTLFSKVTELQPKNVRAWLQLSDAAHLAKNNPQSMDAAKRVLELSPAAIEGYQRVARTYAAMGDSKAALRVAADAQRVLPKDPSSYRLEADLWAAEKHWDECVAALRKGLSVAPHTSLATKLHDALTSAGKTGEANAAMHAWLTAHPNDVIARGYLGERLALEGEFAKARKEFDAIVTHDANNALALNNLAWVSFKLNDPQALKTAQRAMALRPDDPVILDTLGTILISQGQSANGIEMLQRAVALAPGSDRLRLNLAKGHIQSGDRNAARKELSVIANRPVDSAEKQEAISLIQTL